MFHKAIDLQFRDGTVMEVTFRDGKVMQYDMAALFEKYPQLCALKDRALFQSGKLLGYGIVWNDELDLELEAIYEQGKLVRMAKIAETLMAGDAVFAARAQKGLSQKELAEATGIDQSDISKIERGVANPSIKTLQRIAEALDGELQISIRTKA